MSADLRQQELWVSYRHWPVWNRQITQYWAQSWQFQNLLECVILQIRYVEAMLFLHHWHFPFGMRLFMRRKHNHGFQISSHFWWLASVSDRTPKLFSSKTGYHYNMISQKTDNASATCSVRRHRREFWLSPLRNNSWQAADWVQLQTLGGELVIG